MKLLLSSLVMRVLLSLRSPDVDDPLQILLHGAGLQGFSILVCGSVYSEADFSYFAAFILLELPPTAADLSRKPVPPAPLWLRHDASMLLP